MLYLQSALVAQQGKVIHKQYNGNSIRRDEVKQTHGACDFDQHYSNVIACVLIVWLEQQNYSAYEQKY